MFTDYAKKNTYTMILRATYILVGLIFLLLSIMTLAFSGN